MWDYRARLIRVLDGDTVRLLVDVGFGARHQIDLRLKDVWAPEIGRPGGLEARLFVEDWFSQCDDSEWPVRVATEVTRAEVPDEVRTFTRYVGHLWEIVGEGPNRHLNTDINTFLHR